MFSGISIFRSDWIHYTDGTSEATKWITVVIFPIVPFRRERLRIVDDPRESRKFNVLETVPIRWFPVLQTYLEGWFVFPCLLAGPCMAGLMIGKWLDDTDALKRWNLDAYEGLLPVIGALLYVLWLACVVVLIVGRSSGRWPKKFQERSLPPDVSPEFDVQSRSESESV